MSFSLPNHIRPPKIDPPVKYAGKDDHEIYIRFLERICNWFKSQLMTGDKSDSYRVTLLSSQLEGYALEWLTELMENPPNDDFAALTFANATLDFEQVKYDPTTGPDGLMNELIKYGQRMREKPSPFTICSSFFTAIPDEMFNKLVMDRGFTSEYSNVKDLLDHARQLWVGAKMIRTQRRLAQSTVPVGTRLNNAVRTTPHNGGLRTGSVRTCKSPAIPTETRSFPTAAQAAVLGSGNSTKLCFSCGLMGHIASDPICSRNRDQPGYREWPRVAAQRVIESYSDEWEVIDADTNDPPLEHPDDKWGGTQYEPVDENRDQDVAPDLEALVATLEDEEEPGEAQPRVAAMRHQYFAMRILDDDEYDPLSSPPLSDTETLDDERAHLPRLRQLQSLLLDDRGLRSPPSHDLWVLCTARERDRLPTWTDSEERFERRHLKLLYDYPRSLDPSCDELMEDYEVACLKTGARLPNGDDYQSILLVQAEEQARRNWEQMLQHPVQAQVISHPRVSTLPPLVGETDPNRFTAYIRQTEEYQIEIVRQLTLRTFASVALEATAALPRSAYSMATRNLGLALRRNEETTL
ncbi:hypothetical protein DFH09DRAFT_1318303 [Mycena vulgaris]|nr:hypothetical protein DFH09DRAFT_1318303 [Mycena vulgaris]